MIVTTQFQAHLAINFADQDGRSYGVEETYWITAADEIAAAAKTLEIVDARRLLLPEDCWIEYVDVRTKLYPAISWPLLQNRVYPLVKANGQSYWPSPDSPHIGLWINWRPVGGKGHARLLHFLGDDEIKSGEWQSRCFIPEVCPPKPTAPTTLSRKQLFQYALARIRDLTCHVKRLPDAGGLYQFQQTPWEHIEYSQVGTRYLEHALARMSWEAADRATDSPHFSPCGCVVGVARPCFEMPVRWYVDGLQKTVRFYRARTNAKILPFPTIFWPNYQETGYVNSVNPGTISGMGYRVWTPGFSWSNAPGTAPTGGPNAFLGKASRPFDDSLPTPLNLLPACDEMTPILRVNNSDNSVNCPNTLWITVDLSSMTLVQNDTNHVTISANQADNSISQMNVTSATTTLNIGDASVIQLNISGAPPWRVYGINGGTEGRTVDLLLQSGVTLKHNAAAVAADSMMLMGYVDFSPVLYQGLVTVRLRWSSVLGKWISDGPRVATAANIGEVTLDPQSLGRGNKHFQTLSAGEDPYPTIDATPRIVTHGMNAMEMRTSGTGLYFSLIANPSSSPYNYQCDWILNVGSGLKTQAYTDSAIGHRSIWTLLDAEDASLDLWAPNPSGAPGSLAKYKCNGSAGVSGTLLNGATVVGGIVIALGSPPVGFSGTVVIGGTTLTYSSGILIGATGPDVTWAVEMGLTLTLELGMAAYTPASASMPFDISLTLTPELGFTPFTPASASMPFDIQLTLAPELGQLPIYFVELSAGAGATGSGGPPSWTSPGNITAADGSFASATFTGAETQSDDLQATGFGFSIPSGATILGVLAIEQGKQSAANKLHIANVQLLLAGVPSGNDYGGSYIWGTTNTSTTFGGQNDLWGLSLTPADINNANFGVVIRAAVNAPGNIATADVDWIALRVFYTL